MSDRQEIDARTRICAVYGDPVKHSASPAFQNAGMAALGLNWRYLAFNVRPQDLKEAIEGARRMKFIGLNLTVPHKLLAYSMLNELDESAKTWQAVNTVRFEAPDSTGQWKGLAEFAPEEITDVRAVGYNTDADAIVRSIEEDLGVVAQGATILILGAGGAGQTAALKLAASGAKKLYLVNRTIEKAEAVQKEIATRYPDTETVVNYPDRASNVDLVLNATSLGLRAGDPLPFDSNKFSLSQAGAAYDMIYRPAETPFFTKARDTGCATANGLGMLLYQGAKALEIWSGKPAPIEPMKKALLNNIYGK